VDKEILEQAAARLFDAILLGRRGHTGLSGMFMGSVSANVLENATAIPVWIVDEKGPSRNILAAVDGSESALKAVDHLSFIVGPDADVAISLFHVTPRLQDFCPVDFSDVDVENLERVIREGGRECIDRFYARARRKLMEAGINENRVSLKTKKVAVSVGKTILKEYRSGGYGTLVVGRRGMDRKFFTGSVSHHLVQRFCDGALWVVP